MRVAFVGIKRSPSDMPERYWPTFVRYHLELPFYYSRHAPIDVDIVHPEPILYSEDFSEQGGGSIRCVTERQFRDHETGADYDVVVHWRRWFNDLCDPTARNVVLSQDHSYDATWIEQVADATRVGLLEGVLVFPTWHKENVARELRGVVSESRLYEDLTLGVDTDVYHPMAKDPHHLLWASDPGRGLDALINPFLRLWSKDRRFRLTVTYPDYVKPEAIARFSSFFAHPGVLHLPGLRNGTLLWSLFNGAGILPYSSTFPEPSSRCHRQAMAAGCMVLYPPSMGSPSRLIEDGLTGVVADPYLWPEVIHNAVSTERWKDFGHNARTFALSENWAVQAQRFHRFFSEDKK
jgi:hypothetical protein